MDIILLSLIYAVYIQMVILSLQMSFMSLVLTIIFFLYLRSLLQIRAKSSLIRMHTIYRTIPLRRPHRLVNFKRANIFFIILLIVLNNYLLFLFFLEAQKHCNSAISSISNSTMWHARLGYPSVSSIKYLPNSMYHNVVTFTNCDTCHLAKQTRLQFTDNFSTSSTLFELIHVDVWGSYKDKTHGNCSYFLIIIEDKSRAT